MTHINRSRRLQVGLAGLSVVSALGAAVGLGLTTHTHSASQAGQVTPGTGTTSHRISSGENEGDDSGRSSTSQTGRSQSQQSQSSPVTQPSSSAPQATTSGS